MINNIGDMKVVYLRNSSLTEHPMSDITTAKAFISRNAEKDLKDNSVDVNSFSLLVYDPSNENSYTDRDYKGWYEWRDENDLDINGYSI